MYSFARDHMTDCLYNYIITTIMSKEGNNVGNVNIKFYRL